MKTQSKSLFQKPVFWVAVVGIAVAGYVLTEPESKASTSSKSKTSSKKTRTATKAGKNTVVFTEQDEKAQFQTINAPLKNSFVPVVARSGIGGADASANALPTDFTSGEANWVFTGSVEVNGVRQALLENRTTGEGVFLKRGERWKAAVVQSIREDGIVMDGPSGTKTFGLVDDTPSRSYARNGGAGAANAAQGNNFAPMQLDPRSLRGTIGGGRGFTGSLPMVMPSGGGQMTIGGPAPGGGDGVVIIGE